MKQDQYEVEIKTLLGSKDAADKLRAQLKTKEPNSICTASYTQLNHYFEGGDPVVLAEKLSTALAPVDAEKLMQIACGTNISVRTREMNGEARIVMKASIGDDSSSNGVARLELEAPVPGFSLNDLDQTVLASGYSYQAKWSRTREEYSFGDTTVCIDKNAGYGYLAEFERIIPDASAAIETKQQLLDLMGEFGLKELPQDRLERMFSFYNAHWPEYYGTENIFTVE